MNAHPHLKLVKRRHRAPSPDQQTQRELSWLLYITEGYIANVEHALVINGYTLNKRALRVMHWAQKDAQAISRDIRREMKPK